MMQRMQTYDLYRCTDTVNELHETVKTWAKVGAIRATVEAATGSTGITNQTLKITSTHRGLTPDTVQVQDRFGGYRVDYVIPKSPYTILYLTREDAL